MPVRPKDVTATPPTFLYGQRRNNNGTARVIGKPFKPGQFGYPGGRPKGVSRTVRELCGDSPLRLPQVLLEIAENPKARDRDRIAASSVLLDRGWEKAPAVAAVESHEPGTRPFRHELPVGG
jgi:hypothetical protein